MGCETSSLTEDGLKLVSVEVAVGNRCPIVGSEFDAVEVGIEGDLHLIAYDAAKGESRAGILNASPFRVDRNSVAPSTVLN